jgi:FabA-like domain
MAQSDARLRDGLEHDPEKACPAIDAGCAAVFACDKREAFAQRSCSIKELTLTGHITPEVRRVRYEVDMRQVRRGRLALGIANGRVRADDTCVYVEDMRVSLIASAI